MNQAAVDALVLGMGTFFLGGYAVGLHERPTISIFLSVATKKMLRAS